MHTDKLLSMVDLAGSESKWKAYANSVRNTIPWQFKKNERRYFSLLMKTAQGFANNPKVTNKRSILPCIFTAPKFGLDTDKIFGHIFFIPYKGILTYQLGYKGMIQLSLNSGKVINVRAGLVYKEDEWDFYEDEKGQHYLFKPNFHINHEKEKELFGYSIFTDNDNRHNVHVMPSYHIEAIKRMVLARMNGASTPWSDDLFEPEMRKKTVIRRHWKTEPMSPSIAEAITHEEQNENGDVLTERENEIIMEEILDGEFNKDQHDQTNGIYPDRNSPEGKKLEKELNELG